MSADKHHSSDVVYQRRGTGSIFRMQTAYWVTVKTSKKQYANVKTHKQTILAASCSVQYISLSLSLAKAVSRLQTLCDAAGTAAGPAA